MRLFGFDTSIKRKLDEVNGPVTISHCEIKRSRMGQTMELLLNSSTKIQQADKEVTVPSTYSTQDTNIANIHEIVDFQKVSCIAKILNVNEPMEVSGGKKKQDMTISDSTGNIRLTVWEEHINKLEEDTSYRLSGLTVRTFKGQKFLSSSKDLFKFQKTDDIGDVEYPEDANDNVTISSKKLTMPPL